MDLVGVEPTVGLEILISLATNHLKSGAIISPVRLKPLVHRSNVSNYQSEVGTRTPECYSIDPVIHTHPVNRNVLPSTFTSEARPPESNGLLPILRRKRNQPLLHSRLVLPVYPGCHDSVVAARLSFGVTNDHLQGGFPVRVLTVMAGSIRHSPVSAGHSRLTKYFKGHP